MFRSELSRLFQDNCNGSHLHISGTFSSRVSQSSVNCDTPLQLELFPALRKHLARSEGQSIKHYRTIFIFISRNVSSGKSIISQPLEVKTWHQQPSSGGCPSSEESVKNLSNPRGVDLSLQGRVPHTLNMNNQIIITMSLNSFQMRNMS